jgi:hypothetical protein
VEEFLSKHADGVIGTLRLLAHCAGMMRYLWVAGVLLKDFAAHAESLPRRLGEASESRARQAGRPIRYLTSSAPRKEQVAREIAITDRIEDGLVYILTAVEPCLSLFRGNYEPGGPTRLGPPRQSEVSSRLGRSNN